jgi:hypothetical protein
VEGAAAKRPKKAGVDNSTTKKEELRHGGSKVNNKITERDLKKDKDCVIY